MASTNVSVSGPRRSATSNSREIFNMAIAVAPAITMPAIRRAAVMSTARRETNAQSPRPSSIGQRPRWRRRTRRMQEVLAAEELPDRMRCRLGAAAKHNDREVGERRSGDNRGKREQRPVQGSPVRRTQPPHLDRRPGQEQQQHQRLEAASLRMTARGRRWQDQRLGRAPRTRAALQAVGTMTAQRKWRGWHPGGQSAAAAAAKRAAAHPRPGRRPRGLLSGRSRQPSSVDRALAFLSDDGVVHVCEQSCVQLFDVRVEDFRQIR